jgi:uncharacterized transporter YbjL
VKSIQALRRKGTATVDWLVNMLQTYPEFATFFALAIGFWIGPRKIAGLSLGNVTATLLAALIIGQFAIRIPPNVRFVFSCSSCSRWAGAGTATPALAAIQEAAKSPVPTLGYGVSYAVGNVLLALWGAVMVLLVH